jgi:transcriptional regulator GlxA family with amidase domain
VTAESRGSSAQQHSGTRGVVRGHAVVAVRILRTRLAEPRTLNSLAEQVHLSRSQLVRAFDSTIGMSPMAYLANWVCHLYLGVAHHCDPQL